MQLTGPVFLLIFLPLSLLFILPVPKKHRVTALALLSILWYFLANRQNPIGIVTVFLLVFFSYAIVLPPVTVLPRWRLVFGTVLPLSLLLSARLLAEYGSGAASYPYGLTFVVLAAVSATVDRLHRNAPAPKGLGEFAAYLLFFPFLLFGPLVRWRYFQNLAQNMEFRMDRTALGIRLYMGGLVKRVAVSAVLLRSLEQILAYCNGRLHYLTALLLPLLAFFCFYFFCSGCSDLSRGIALMFGLPLPRDRSFVLLPSDPIRATFRFFRPLAAYLWDYVAAPLARDPAGRVRKWLAATSTLLLWTLFFRTRADVLLFLLPLFLLFTLCIFKPSVLRYRWPRLLLSLFSFLSLALLSLALLMPEPRELIPLFASLRQPANAYHFYYMYSAVADTRYLLAGVIALLVYLPLSRLRPLLRRKSPPFLLSLLRYGELFLLFACFLLALIYFVPQFPEYANVPYHNFYF